MLFINESQPCCSSQRSHRASEPMFNYTCTWNDGTCSPDKVRFMKQRRPADIISGDKGERSFTALFILSITLLHAGHRPRATVPLHLVHRGTFVSLKKRHELLFSSSLNFHSCLETSVTATDEQEEEEVEWRHTIAIDL